MTNDGTWNCYLKFLNVERMHMECCMLNYSKCLAPIAEEILFIERNEQ